VAKSAINDDLFSYLVRLGDDHLIIGHRLSQWCGHAPTLEEDLALSNIALDMVGQARSLYSYAGEIEGKGRSEDDLAFLRKEHQYHNLMLVERPNGDFAHTIIRQLFFSVFAELLWEQLSVSNDTRLSQIAAKARKEAAYHVRHSAQWAIRLGDGTNESARRVEDAVTTMAPNLAEMFDDDDISSRLAAAGVAPDMGELKKAWKRSIDEIFKQADINPDLLDVIAVKGARQGRHTESMGHILAELQYMQRTYPGCQW